jgi:inorganic phosphate transporter, PiT family
MPDLVLLSVIAIIVLALVFDFTNGFHDAANSIATVVSTRVLTPRMAVVWAAFFNFAAVLVFHTGVANTVGKTVDPDVVSEAVVFAGLVGAVAWNFFTWWLGLPTSSSHALIGGFAGAGVAKAGFSVLNAASLEKTILFIALSPLLGMTLGFLLMLANLWLFRRATPARVDRLFRRLQLLSAAAFSLGHGGNDAQKTMGIISALLVGSGHLQLEANGDLPVPNWVVLAAYSAIALGTLSGGWRIVKTLGQRITALKPVGGFSA